MATQKKIKPQPADDNMRRVQQYNWSAMKPFVKFGLGAMQVIGHALIFIVKGAFKLRPDKPKDEITKYKK